MQANYICSFCVGDTILLRCLFCHRNNTNRTKASWMKLPQEIRHSTHFAWQGWRDTRLKYQPTIPFVPDIVIRDLILIRSVSRSETLVRIAAVICLDLEHQIQACCRHSLARQRARTGPRIARSRSGRPNVTRQTFTNEILLRLFLTRVASSHVLLLGPCAPNETVPGLKPFLRGSSPLESAKGARGTSKIWCAPNVDFWASLERP